MGDAEDGGTQRDPAGVKMDQLRSLLYDERFADALDEIDGLPTDMRGRVDIQNVKGICLIHLGRPHEALSVLSDVLDAHPDDEMTRHNRNEALCSVCMLRIEAANRRFTSGDISGALTAYNLLPRIHLEELRELRPQMLYTFHNNRGAVQMQLERYGDALADFEDAVALRPDSPDAHHNCGVALKALKRYELALQEFDVCLQHDPTSYSALCGKSEVIASMSRFDKAIEVASQAIEVNDNPESFRAFLSRGFARLKSGIYGGAVRDFEAAEGRGCSSKEFFTMYELALALYGDELNAMGDYDRAIPLYERALGLGSSELPSVDLLFNLSLAKLRSGDDSEDPANGFRQVLSQRPTHFQAAVALGLHLLETSEPSSQEAHEACLWLSRSLDMRPGEIELLYHLGLAFMKVGNMKDAAAAFTEVLEACPDHQLATDGLSRVEGFNAGFAVAAAQARRQSMAEGAGKRSGYAMPEGPFGSHYDDSPEVDRALSHHDGDRRSTRSDTYSDGAPGNTFREIAYLREALRRRDESIEALQEEIAGLRAQLREARGSPAAAVAGDAKLGELKETSMDVEVASAKAELPSGEGSPGNGAPTARPTSWEMAAAAPNGDDMKQRDSMLAQIERMGPETEVTSALADGKTSFEEVRGESPRRLSADTPQRTRFEVRESFQKHRMAPSVNKTDIVALGSADRQDALVDMRFDLATLQSPGPFPLGIKVHEREKYLTDEAFEAAFNCSREWFAQLPKWRRTAMKKEVGLF